jgi:hypothetical protein
LQKDPQERMSDVRDWRLLLDDVETSRPPRRRRASVVTMVLAALLVVAYVTFQMRPAPSSPIEPPAVSRLSIVTPAAAPLSSLGGLDLAIAPDGRRIAYFAHVPGTDRIRLYVRELDGLEAMPVPGVEFPSTGAGNMNPFFSANGKSVGLFVLGRGVIRVPIDGGPQVKIIDPPAPGFVGAAWAADNTLIYSSGWQLLRVSAAGAAHPSR